MKFQIKIIIATTIVLIVILFYLNTIIISFPEHMKEAHWKFQEYLWNVLLWESLLVLTLMFILYKIIDRMTKQEREYRDFLELILLALSHKFGNFLAVQKGNIEILKLRHDPKAIERLQRSYNYLQEDFNRVLETINRFKELSQSKEKINLREVIEKSLSLISSEFEKFKLQDIYIYGNRQIIENIIFPIIENSFKYSDGKIQIRLGKKYLAIRNKIILNEKGSGVGLKIAEALAKKQGFPLLYKVKGSYFMAFLKFK